MKAVTKPPKRPPTSSTVRPIPAALVLEAIPADLQRSSVAAALDHFEVGEAQRAIDTARHAKSLRAYIELLERTLGNEQAENARRLEQLDSQHQTAIESLTRDKDREIEALTKERDRLKADLAKVQGRLADAERRLRAIGAEAHAGERSIETTKYTL